MTRFVLVLAAAAVTTDIASAQVTKPQPVTTYAFRVPVEVQACSIDGVVTGPAVTAPTGSKFYYLQTPPNKSVVVIQFLTWDSDTEEYEMFNRSAGSAGVKRFCVNEGHFQQLSERVYAKGWSSRQVAGGALLLPVKMRGLRRGPFDFSKDITLGTAAGLKVRMNETRDEFLSMLIGVGLTSVTLDSANTLGAVRQGTDRAALTWTLGLMMDVDKFQFGAFIGRDRLSQPNQNDWIYQGRNWVAVGLGYSLFGPAPAEKPASGNNTK